jgi:hypothetical protein
MKLIANVVIVMLIATNIFGQNSAIDKYFSAYESNEAFSTVFVSPKMFSMITSATKDSKGEIADVIKDIKGLKILSTQKNGSKYYNEAIQKLPVSEYEVLMTVKDKGENIKFLTKGTGNNISELLLLIGGNTNFTLMSFVGNLDLAKIAKLANKLELNGSEHLEKLKNKK